MSWKASAWAAKNRVGNPTRKLVLLALAENANADGYSPVGHAYLADVAECSEKSVQRALDALESMGLLIRRRRRKSNGRLGGYDMWLQLHQEQFVFEPRAASKGSGAPSQEDKLATGQNVHWTDPSGLSDDDQRTESPQRGDTESTPSPVYPRCSSPEGTRAHAKVGRTIDWNGWTLNLRNAPEALTESALIEWLTWKSETDRRWRPSPLVIDGVMSELRKAADKGWDPDQVLGLWMNAGWSSFRSEYLDRLAPASTGGHGGGMAGTARRVGDRLRASEQERQKRSEGNG